MAVAEIGQVWRKKSERREVVFVSYDPFVCRTLVGPKSGNRREVNSGIKAWMRWKTGAVLVGCVERR